MTLLNLTHFPMLRTLALAMAALAGGAFSAAQAAEDEMELHCIFTYKESTQFTFGGPMRRSEINEEETITIFFNPSKPPMCLGGGMAGDCVVSSTEIRWSDENPGMFNGTRTTVKISRVTGAYEHMSWIGTNGNAPRYTKTTGSCEKPQRRF